MDLSFPICMVTSTNTMYGYKIVTYKTSSDNFLSSDVLQKLFPASHLFATRFSMHNITSKMFTVINPLDYFNGVYITQYWLFIFYIYI